MTALTQDKAIVRADGVELDIPMAASDIIYGGSLVAVNAAGYALPGSDTAGLLFAGVAVEQKDNAAGAAGDQDIVVRRKGLILVNLGTAISQANVGDKVYLVDDQTVDVAANTTNNILAGVIVKYVSTTQAYIDIEPAINQVT